MREITFREATRADAEFVAAHLRKADLDEVEAQGYTAFQAVELSRQTSDYVWAGFIDGVPAMLFGCGQCLLSPVAEVWALGTDLCTEVPREMLFYGRKKLREMLDIYLEMQNYSDARNTASHRWLKKLGFTIHPARPYGVNGEEFCKITISKEEV